MSEQQYNSSTQDGSTQLYVGSSLLDSQLETADKIEIGRVASIQAEWRDDGRLVLTALCTGPQALAHRVARPLGTLFRWLFRNRFDHAIPMSELTDISLVLSLRGDAIEYPTGQADRWLAQHVLRWIPGSGYRKGTQHPTQLVGYTSSTSARILLLEELLGSNIVTASGKRVGRIFDAQLSPGPDYEVVALMYGRNALLSRVNVLRSAVHAFHINDKLETISWSQVASFAHHTVTLKKS
jgi:sporulation protein YlmC with PRC-barrel domain